MCGRKIASFNMLARGSSDALRHHQAPPAHRHRAATDTAGTWRRTAQRIHVQIEIVQRQPPQRRGYRFGTVTLMLLILAMLGALAGCTQAMAQPSSWQSHREGFMTRYQGNDRDGGQWTGNSFKQGFTTFSEFNGPHGESTRCRSWQQGWQTFTECD